uniref:LETM1 domain-containing protein n=1 Tax=Globodera pallida TaxID=36090 RepID=A0A183CHQ8_GLOPA
MIYPSSVAFIVARAVCRRCPSVLALSNLQSSSFPASPSLLVVERRTFASAPVANGPKLGNEGGSVVGMKKRCEQWLECSYPSVYKLYRLIIDGSKWCFYDLKTFCWLTYGLRMGRITLSDLNANELFVYVQAGSQLVKLSILAVLAVVPFGFPLLFISMLFAPKYVLTRHFWSDSQSQQFQASHFVRNERKFFPVIVEALKQLDSSTPIGKLPLSVEQLVVKKAVKIPNSLDTFPWQHRLSLKRMHHLPLWATDGALLKHINLLQLLDTKMARDRDSVEKLSLRDLQTHLYLRNLNFARMNVDQMRAALVQWLGHFKDLSSCDPLLYAHVPVLTQANSNDLERDSVEKLSLRDLQTHLYLRNLNFARMNVDQMRAALVQWLGHFKDLSSCDPLLYAHVPVLTQANSNDLERWKKGAAAKADALKMSKQQFLDNLEWKELGQKSTNMAKRSAEVVKPMLRKGSEMAAEGLKEVGKAMKKARN